MISNKKKILKCMGKGEVNEKVVEECRTRINESFRKSLKRIEKLRDKK